MGKRKKNEAPAETAQPSEASIPTETQFPVQQQEGRFDGNIAETAPLSGEEDQRQQFAIDYKKPMPIASNNLAGVELRKFERIKQMQLHFRKEVPDSVAQMLNDKGWTFRPTEEVYTKQFGGDGAGAAYIEARRLFQQICQQLAPEKGQPPF